jgi:uncharacterized protein YutE (UPF0331/DUF86 family)
MTINPDVVRTRCSEIEESIGRLERVGRLPLERFLGDQDLLDIACYRLLLAIEAALALCYHVSAKHLGKAPEDYAACFGNLAEASLIPGDLATRLQRMSRFRNLLVHMYWKLDYRLVYEILQRDLGDLRTFSSLMASLVAS